MLDFLASARVFGAFDRTLQARMGRTEPSTIETHAFDAIVPCGLIDDLMKIADATSSSFVVHDVGAR